MRDGEELRSSRWKGCCPKMALHTYSVSLTPNYQERTRVMTNTPDAKTAALIEVYGVAGLSTVGSSATVHLVNRSAHKTVCGKVPNTLFGLDLQYSDQVTCGRCAKLGFHSVNAWLRYSRIPTTREDGNE